MHGTYNVGKNMRIKKYTYIKIYKDKWRCNMHTSSGCWKHWKLCVTFKCLPIGLRDLPHAWSNVVNLAVKKRESFQSHVRFVTLGDHPPVSINWSHINSMRWAPKRHDLERLGPWPRETACHEPPVTVHSPWTRNSCYPLIDGIIWRAKNQNKSHLGSRVE